MKYNISETKIVSSFFWVLLEKFGYSSISLLSTLILARLLSPYEFGLVGSVTIITSISNMIVESGMGAALVSKKNATNEDYNTVFTLNLFMSSLLYSLIFIGAPFIADYFRNSLLKDIVRILSITLIFNAFTLVQRTLLIKELLFRKQSFIALFSLLLSGITATFVAYRGGGAWSIVVQLVLYSAVYSIAIFFVIRYIPKIQFSFSSFRELLGFGGRITLSSAIQVGYSDIVSSIIAKVYTIQTTGLYSQSQKLISFPINIFRSLFDGVAFPILSRIENEMEFKKKCSQINRVIYFIGFPFLLIIPFNTNKIIKIVLGEQWLAADDIFTILSISVVVLLIEIATFNILKSSGEVKMFLRIGIYRTIIGFVVLIITFSFSIQIFLFGIVLSTIASVFIAICSVSRKTIYKINDQLGDIFLPLMIALIANFAAFLVLYIFKIDRDILHLLLYVVFVLVFFILQCVLFRIKEFSYIIQLIKLKF